MAIKEFRRPYDYTPWQTKEVIQGEQHTIPMSPPYDIYLIHIPRKETPSTVRIPGFTEVDGPPGPGQYRVHYEEPGGDPLGRVEFHASDAGKLVAVDYHACGTVIWGEDRGDGRPNIAELQEVLERVQEAGGIDYGSSGFANVKAALDALAGVRIVEMGSNSNGTYVRWENGLQVCWATSIPITFSGTNFAPGTWAFPASFFGTPFKAGMSEGGDQTYSMEFVFSVGAGSTTYVAKLDSPQSATRNIALFAIGRWK